MATCKYCGNPAGMFKKVHPECESKFAGGKLQITNLLNSAFDSLPSDPDFLDSLEQTGRDSYIDSYTIRSQIISRWDSEVERAFDDGVLTPEEESKLMDIAEFFSLSQSELESNGSYSRLVKGAVLRDLLEGKLPDRINISGDLPFNFVKDEQLVWLFHDVEYYEVKTKTQYVGGSQGVSLRVAKGVYYRVGGFKGERVQSDHTSLVDIGMLGVTNKHLYFSGSAKRFRIAVARHDKRGGFLQDKLWESGLIFRNRSGILQIVSGGLR